MGNLGMNLEYNEAADSERTEIYKRAISTYGEEAQIRMVFEEMAELQKELCKHLRGKEPFEQIIRIAEEIADVEIMLDQMKILFKLNEAVESHKEYKIFRLNQNLNKEEGGIKHE